ncbi:bile acid:sodium symporter family protein [Corynebacterium pilosum]|uniref:Bile acid transporter n=1 Tax=Corynebacterium pilosum TaxID=35756 RepID=A0A376CLH4_9CORY|nr:bile acid:sodium symporter [Corynebacterium pilosum]STC69336.1 bile acid transporter [Corynebacterium pilosum]
MFEFFQWLSSTATTIFVLTSMFNVGLTQNPKKIVQHLSNWQYLTRMVVANLFVVPAVMLLFITIFEIDGPYAIALTIFACAAGAPLLIKLTQQSDNDISAGATIQMVLMVATVFILPFYLSLLLEGVEVGIWDIAKPLLLQMILPLVIGMILHQVAEKFAGVIQPWIAKISNIALYTLLGATIIGYLPQLADWQLWKAIAVGMVALLLTFYIGYGTGHGNETRSQLGALGTAQRNTAASMITAGSFTDPMVFVTIAMLNTLMMFVLLGLATRLGNDAKIAFLEPLEADMPGDAKRPYANA